MLACQLHMIGSEKKYAPRVMTLHLHSSALQASLWSMEVMKAQTKVQQASLFRASTKKGTIETLKLINGILF